MLRAQALLIAFLPLLASAAGVSGASALEFTRHAVAFGGSQSGRFLRHLIELGMNKDEPLNRFVRRIGAGRFEPALGPATLCGVAVETDDATGLARRIGAVRLGGRLEEARPTFW